MKQKSAASATSKKRHSHEQKQIPHLRHSSPRQTHNRRMEIRPHKRHNHRQNRKPNPRIPKRRLLLHQNNTSGKTHPHPDSQSTLCRSTWNLRHPRRLQPRNRPHKPHSNRQPDIKPSAHPPQRKLPKPASAKKNQRRRRSSPCSKLRNRKCSISMLALEYNCSRKTVRRLIRAAGLRREKC